MKYSKYSTIIIGSGVAGLYAALKIEQQVNLTDGLLLITKSKLGESNSRYAQGGIVGVMKENKADTTASHISDTIKAGAGLSDFNTVKYISEHSDSVIKDLLKFGVEFDRDENNNLCFTKEAAHSVRRILHSGGDATGRMIEQALCKKVKENENIDIYEQTVAVELIVNSKDECKGVLVFNDETQEYETIYSSAVILATGGIGQLYKYTTNPIGATGDGLALAYNAGAVMQDMEFVQFHPTALAIDGDENRFLISEAVRGEGAKLCDADGVEFMSKYDSRKELAPRDIVTRANYNEMIENGTDCVYLNATCIESSKLAKRFPNISKKCLENGIDIAHDFIPVAPAAHYQCGGVKTNMNGQTTVPGLYAIGEVACTGLHGANRLASNSLLEAIVMAQRVAQYTVNEQITLSQIPIPPWQSGNAQNSDELVVLNHNWDEIRRLMWDYVGIVRTTRRLERARTRIENIIDEIREYYWDFTVTKEILELRNIARVAWIIIVSALSRKESRGLHYTLDYPNSDPALSQKNTLLIRSVEPKS